MFVRIVFLGDVDDSRGAVDDVQFQLGERRHLSADGRTLAGEQSQHGQLGTHEVLGNVRDEVQRPRGSGVVGQREAVVEVAKVSRERQKVVRTRPVL